MKQWECRDLGECKEFLCMRVTHKNGTICLDQTVYLEKVLLRFAATPLPQGYKPLENTNSPDPSIWSKFQSVIGSLLYIHQ